MWYSPIYAVIKYDKTRQNPGSIGNNPYLVRFPGMPAPRRALGDHLFLRQVACSVERDYRIHNLPTEDAHESSQTAKSIAVPQFHPVHQTVTALTFHLFLPIARSADPPWRTNPLNQVRPHSRRTDAADRLEVGRFAGFHSEASVISCIP